MWELPESDELSPHPSMDGALESFVRIVRNKNESMAQVGKRALKVAERYGPLFLCGHLKPSNHNERCLIRRVLSEKGSEQIFRWRWLAETVGELLSFAAVLSNAEKFEDVKEHPVGQLVNEYSGGLVEERTEKSVSVGPRPLTDRSKGHAIPVTLNNAYQYLERRVGDLIEESSIRPSVQWNPDKRQFDFGFEEGNLGLYGAVVLQMALKIGGATRWLRCDACHGIYYRPPNRKMPGRSKFNYCEDCNRADIKRSVQRRRTKEAVKDD